MTRYVTARELAEILSRVPEEKLDKPVLVFDNNYGYFTGVIGVGSAEDELQVPEVKNHVLIQLHCHYYGKD